MNIHTRPDWVILGGGQTNGGVMVIASTQLTHAELEVAYDRGEYLDILSPFILNDRRRVTLTVEMGQFVIIIAEDYQTAMKRLFEQWTPRAAERPSIEGRRTLPPGL